MKISRLSSLTLTLAVAAFALGHANPAFAGNDKNCDPPDLHPSCKDNGDGGGGDGGDGGIEYTAVLTGAFAFDTENNPVIVTANKQGNVLKGAKEVTLSRPYDPADPDDPVDPSLLLLRQMIWDSVFEECYNFFGPTSVNVSGFKAPAGKKGWTIEKAGGVRVNFRLRFSQEDLPGVSLIPDSVWVALSLIGDRKFHETFPPPGMIQLSHFTIHGQTESGVTPRLACANENFALVDFPIVPPIYLTITPTNTE